MEKKALKFFHFHKLFPTNFNLVFLAPIIGRPQFRLYYYKKTVTNFPGSAPALPLNRMFNSAEYVEACLKGSSFPFTSAIHYISPLEYKNTESPWYTSNACSTNITDSERNFHSYLLSPGWDWVTFCITAPLLTTLSSRCCPVFLPPHLEQVLCFLSGLFHVHSCALISVSLKNGN